MNSGVRTLVYGFHEPSLAAAIEQLQAERVLSVVHWIGVSNAERSFDDDIHQWHLSGIGDAAPIVDTIAGLDVGGKIMNTHHDQIVDQLSRNVVCQSLAPDAYPSLIASLAIRFERLLLEKRVQYLLLQNLPHEGFELVLYLVARHHKVATLMTHQSVIANHFFYCYELQDFGWFHQIEVDREVGDFDVPKQFRKELFYMRGVRESLIQADRRSWLDQCKRHVLMAKIGWKLLKQRLGWYDFLNRPGPRIPPEQRYAWELQRATVARAPLSNSFVYFPLHLQPELTTSAIGDDFADQLCAIENLSAWIPAGWSIYVKENPKQSYRYRDSSFFERLRKLKNVILVDRTLDTYSLLANCKCAATITGTVGWEAITGGKRVIVFGRPWYLTLPGVHKWPPMESALGLSLQPIDHTELTEATRNLLCKSGSGVVDIAYSASVPDYSAPKNTALVADFLRRQLVKIRDPASKRGV